MYKIKLFTEFGEMYLPSHLSELPKWEFIKCFDVRKNTIYVNKNQIKFYKIYNEDLSNKKEEWKQ